MGAAAVPRENPPRTGRGTVAQSAMVEGASCRSPNPLRQRFALPPPRQRGGKAQLQGPARLRSLPAEIERLEAEVAADEAALHDPDLYVRDPDRFGRLTERIARNRAEIEAAEVRWLEVAELAEAIAR